MKIKNYKLRISAGGGSAKGGKKCGSGLSTAIYLSLFFNFSFLIFNCRAASPVSETVTNLYGEAEAYISQDDYFWNTTLILTNCIAYAGTATSSPRQDLTGRTLQLKIGTTSSNIAYTAYAINATNGLWWASITIPTNWEVPKLQFTIDPTNTPIIYQFKLLKAKQPL